MATKIIHTNQKIKVELEGTCNKLINVKLSNIDNNQFFEFTVTLDCVDSFSDSLVNFCNMVKLAIEGKEW